MGLFTRSGSRPSHSRSHSREITHRPGLEPLPIVQREDGQGENLEFKTDLYDIGLSSDWNYPNRKTMEDAAVVISEFMDIRGCLFLAIYDGHAGAQCAQIAAEHLHHILADILKAQGAQKDVSLALSQAFLRMDEQFKTMEVRNSGCTAVVAVSCFMSESNQIVSSSTPSAQRKLFVANVGDSRAVLGAKTADTKSSGRTGNVAPQTPDSFQNDTKDEDSKEDDPSAEVGSVVTLEDADQFGAIEARRLSYDHRCSDIHEQRRVANTGGLMVNNRVNGMLAVTRSLGDLSMKDYVVGAPYTTESLLDPKKQPILLLACDGLWDVCSDERAVQLVDTTIKQPGNNCGTASDELLQHALRSFSMDNITVMVVKFTL